MNTEQIKAEIIRYKNRASSLAHRNFQEEAVDAIWEIALQISMLREAIEESVDHERRQ